MCESHFRFDVPYLTESFLADMCWSKKLVLVKTLLTYILTYDMERSPAWEVNQFSVSQEIPHILWSLKVHYCIHMCPPPAPIPSSRSEAFCMNISEQDTFLQWVVSTSPSPQAGGPPPVGCPRLLIQYIRGYPPYWRPSLHPQPEDAPCPGDRDSLFFQYSGKLLPDYKVSRHSRPQSASLVMISKGIWATQAVVINYYYLPGCTTFPHLPAPIEHL
jgi:hypothetical protein